MAEYDNTLANPVFAADRGYVDRVIMRPTRPGSRVGQALRACVRSARCYPQEAWEHSPVSTSFEVTHGNPSDEELAVVVSLLTAAGNSGRQPALSADVELGPPGDASDARRRTGAWFDQDCPSRDRRQRHRPGLQQGSPCTCLSYSTVLRRQTSVVRRLARG